MQPTLPENVPALDARTVALGILEKVMSNEESRFSNLNVRAINLLSASSIVIALVGVFAKEALKEDFGWPRYPFAGLTLLALVLLGLTACFLLSVVLRPSRRVLVGNNSLFDDPQLITLPEQAQAIAFDEYKAVIKDLRTRNSSKVWALHWAYSLFLIALVLLIIAVSLGFVNVFI